MDLVQLPAIVWRWRWVIVAVVAVPVLAQGLRLGTSSTPYEAAVRVQITAPPLEDVQLLETGNRSSSYLRDDLTLVSSNFRAVVSSPEVYDRTIQQLHLQGRDRAYKVTASPVFDSNFIDLLVAARNPSTAQAIVNAHAAQAIRYYGELRAQPAAATKDFLDAQIGSLRATLTSSSAVAAGATAASQASASPAVVAASVEAQQARDTYQLLLSKRAEAALLEQDALRATYIQVVEPASAATRKAWIRTAVILLGLSLVGSMGLGLLLALLLESLFRRASVPPAAQAGQMNGYSVGNALTEAEHWAVHGSRR